MIQIRPWLYIGRYRDTCNLDLLSAHGINSMLELAERVEQPGITCLYLPVEDGEPIAPSLLRKGVDFVRNQKRDGQVVLVACGAGQSRSVAFAIAALKEEEGVNLLDAFRTIRQVHPEALPHPELWKSLCEYYQEEWDIRQMINVAWGRES